LLIVDGWLIIRIMAIDDAMYDDILSRVECGESVISICKDIKISERTFYAFRASSEERGKKYARAKEKQQDYYADQIIEIADNASKDIEVDSEGRPYIDGFSVQRAKLMIDSRKWTMSKLVPKKYGDKQAVEHTSPDGSMSPAQSMDDKEIARRIAFVLQDSINKQNKE
jgi:hypothetical protein